MSIDATAESGNGNLTAVVDWVRNNRGNYLDRKAWNMAVCSRLLEAGLSPTVARVIQYGSWGSSQYVGEDIKAWRASTAKALLEIAPIRPSVPREVALEANAYVERCFSLARIWADEERVQPLLYELARIKTDAGLVRSESLVNASQVVELRVALEAASSKIAALEERSNALDSENRSIAEKAVEEALQVQVEHARALKTLHAHFDGQRAIDGARHADLLCGVRAELLTLRSDAAVAEERSREERNRLLLLLDAANLSLREQVKAMKSKNEKGAKKFTASRRK